MGKKNVATEQPNLTVVKPEPKFAVYSVKVMNDASPSNFAEWLSARLTEMGQVFKVKTLKSGRVSITVGKTTAGAPKMTPEQKTAVSQYRRLLRTDPKTAGLISKLSEGGTAISDEKRAQILALLAS